MTSNTLRVLTVLSLAVAALAAPSATATAAATVRCGDTITGSVTLTADLYCGDRSGLTLQPGASLDLGGHKINGNGNAGLLVPRAGNVTVSNGAVRSFITDIRTYGDIGASPGPIRLTGLVIAGASLGVATTGNFNDPPPFTNLQISNSSFLNNGNYAVDATSATVTIRDSAFSGAVDHPDSTEGVVGSNGTLTITNSSFRGFTAAVRCARVCSVTDDFLQDSSTCAYPAPGTTISGNRFIRCTVGVSVDGAKPAVIVTRNQFRQNGVAVDALDADVIVTHNDVRDGTTGVHYRRLAPPAFKRTNVAVSFNILTRNHDGIRVDAPADLAPIVRVGGNAVIDNVDYGIYAPGATDRGGNTASGNGHDPQCVGVMCTQP